jgi:hypothetical protein
MKKTIHFNKETLDELDKLIKIMGIEGYGDIPKAIKFSITYTLFRLKEDLKVIPNLNESDFDNWLSSVLHLRKQKIKVDKIREIGQQS